MNLTLLERLVEQDFGYSRSGRRWGRSDIHSSLVVDAEKQVFFYNDKGIVGSTLDYLVKVRGMDYTSAKEFMKSQVDYTDAFIHYHTEGKEIITYPPLADSFHEIGKIKREYFYDRGVTDDSIDRFNLGHYAGWATIPIYEDTLLRNIQMRKDNPKTMKKYYRGMGASLFNADVLKFNKEIYYVEGPVDAIVMIQNEGVPVISSDSGGAFNLKWLVRFVQIHTIHLVFDNDPAGVNESKRLAKILGTNRCKIYTFSEFEEQGYDPVDYYRNDNKDLVSLVKEKEKFAMEL
jgi:DNA primase